MKQKSYLVTSIDFDFEDWYERNWDFPISKEDQQFIIDNALGVWFAFDEEHLIDHISDTIGWCIKSIDFQPNRPHALTSYM